jgi:hypothetical protein
LKGEARRTNSSSHKARGFIGSSCMHPFISGHMRKIARPNERSIEIEVV